MQHFAAYTDLAMTQGLEFHDARLLDLVRNEDGSGFMLLHACIYRSDGVVFEEPQESGWQNCRLSFLNMRVEGADVEPDVYVSKGRILIKGKVQENVVLLPANHIGSIEIEMVISPLFEALRIQASEMSSTLEGHWSFEKTWTLDDMTE